jgi:hypothetical protein
MSEQSLEELANPEVIEESIEHVDDEPTLDDVDESPDDDGEELEHEGQKYRIPKELKPLLMMQSDYTKKTQELADQRRSFETHQNQVNQIIQQNFTDASKVVAMDERLASFKAVDWTTLSNQNPLQAQQLWFEFQQLKENRDTLANSVIAREQSRINQERELTAQRLAEGNAQLAKEIPGWSNELKSKLVAFAISNGINEQELSQVTDPRFVKLLHSAYVGAQVLKKGKPAPAEVDAKPVKTVGKSSSATNTMERMPIDSWMKARNKQTQTRRSR